MLKNQRTNHEKTAAFWVPPVAGLILVLILFLPGNAFAIQGACYNCHTMHNSQDGSMAVGGPSPKLLLGSGCIGCHTGTNDGSNSIPYVLSTGAPTFGSNTLAGGNFYWVADSGGNDDTKGHNVYGIATQDANIDTTEGAPGNPNSCADSCHVTLATSTGACMGCHLNPAHHSNSSGYVEVAPWYRWLAKCNDGAADSTYGVKGIEDDDWNYETGTDHNEYLGVAGGHTATQSITNYNMTGFCCGCHGNFHVEQDGGSKWIRHPSDYVIPNSGEYAAAFGGGGADSYDATVPVARPAGFTWAGGSSNAVTINSDMVMCLSCHVAHGSPYPDMLRWDYDLMIVGTEGGGQGKGCFVCHTQKDG